MSKKKMVNSVDILKNVTDVVKKKKRCNRFKKM